MISIPKTRLTRTALVVVGVAATVAAAVALVPQTATTSLVITAQFENSVGLYQGNDVSVLGMPVGKVSKITPKDSYVEVELTIDKNIDVPADVSAATVSTSILTDRHVELTPPYHGGPKLASGDALGLSRTHTPVEFDRTLAMINKLSRSLSGDHKGGGPLADLIGLGAQISTGSGAELRTTLDRMSQALRLGADSGARTKKDIQTIAANAAELAHAAADNDDTIRQFGSNIRQLSDLIDEQDIGSGSTGAKLNEIVDQLTTLLNDNRDGLKNSVTDSTTLTKAMVDYRRELAEFFDVTPLALDNVYNTVDTNAGSVRVHPLLDKAMFDTQTTKEICNLMGLKQLGCATGKLQDYGPDFGLTSVLDYMAGTQ